MSLGLVLDFRGDTALETAADMRALTLAFAEAREVGDRFSLVVAGGPPGLVVKPEEFRHGRLAVALDALLARDASVGPPALDLAEAVATAFRAACRREGPDATLGTSAVVLVTGQPLGAAAEALADLAHQGAAAGVPLSVIGVGVGVPLRELDRLALAGQGSRRLLEGRADATRLVEAELAESGDVVARAVRLRIRLAPEVRLVGIVGSRRLDDAQAERVREAERGVDLGLARSLGIEADRGLDEDGIQIVIPAFHAGDAHAILLDVVAPGPGAIADVGVRYKDLVLSRNGAARASLSLPAGGPDPGPLERNVLENLLTWRLAETLGGAASALDAGDPRRAAAMLGEAASLREGLLARGPGFSGDPELTRDAAMVREYLRLLTTSAAGPQLAHIADSLRYAGRVKRLSRPAPLLTGTL